MHSKPKPYCEQINIRGWVGGALLMLGAIWLSLIVRDLYLSVVSPEATETTKVTFLRWETLIFSGVAVVVIALGTFLFLHTRPVKPGYSQKSRHHSSSSAKPHSRPSQNRDDETVRFDPVPTSTQGSASGSSGRVKTRVKKRVRIRIRIDDK